MEATGNVGVGHNLKNERRGGGVKEYRRIFIK